MADHTSFPTAAQETTPQPNERFVRPFQAFAKLESSSGIVLLACTAVALFWANSAWGDSYQDLFHHTKLAIGFGDFSMAKSLEHWINDGLMALFFLLVGLEIKREVLMGELGSLKQASLPIAGAIGGMVVPAGIYAALNWGQPGIEGWGVPMATDIAFALGVMALLGKRVPMSLRIFLTSLAIVDDLGALMVIAIFYTDDIAGDFLLYAGIATALLIVLNRMGVRRPVVYLLVGVALWYCVFMSGVHATLAGVVLAMTIPVSARVDTKDFERSSKAVLENFSEDVSESDTATARQRAAARTLISNCKQVLPPLHRLEHRLHPWAAFAIIPIFAIANAGVELGGESSGEGGKIALGVILGLVIGKPLGIAGLCFIAVKLGFASLPKGVNWVQIVGAGLLGGIGFTMALFISNLAFDADALDTAKIGVLIASAIAGVAGLVVLAIGSKKPQTLAGVDAARD